MTRIGSQAPLLAGVIAALVVGTMMGGLSPMYIGALVGAAGFAESTAGLTVTVELIALAISLTAGSRWFVQAQPLRLAAIGAAIHLVAQLLSIPASELATLLCVRALSGVGASFALLAASMVISRTANPDRFVATAMVGAGLAFTGVMSLCGIAVDAWGVAGFYIVAAGTGAVSLSMLLFAQTYGVATGVVESGDRGATATAINARTIVGTMMVAVGVITFVGQAGWSFAERSGAHAGLSPSELGGWLGAGNLFSVAGSVLAALVAHRVPRLPAVTLGVLATGLSCAFFVDAESRWSYVIPVLVNGFAFGFSTPFVYGTAARLDASGAVVAYVNTTVLITQSTTPYLAGVLIAASSYHALALTIAAGSVLSAALMVPACQRVIASARTAYALSSRDPA